MNVLQRKRWSARLLRQRQRLVWPEGIVCEHGGRQTDRYEHPHADGAAVGGQQLARVPAKSKRA